jgi:hypothetical protein
LIFHGHLLPVFCWYHCQNTSFLPSPGLPVPHSKPSWVTNSFSLSSGVGKSFHWT